MMEDNRKRLAINLYLDDESQLSAFRIIEGKPTRQRADFQRDCLVAGIALSKVDPRLPGMMASALSHEIAFSTVQHLLNAIKPIEQTSNATAVAWQKRERNTLSPEQEWLAWRPISESNYNECLKQGSPNIEVRALWANSEQNTQANITEINNIPEQMKTSPTEGMKLQTHCENNTDSVAKEETNTSEERKPASNTASSARTMFLSD